MDDLDCPADDFDFCRMCELPMYQKDDPKKFMVFACRSCGLEKPCDFLYTLEKKRVNGISVLPDVKDQGERGICVPTALLTLVEAEIKTSKAEMNEDFNQELSLDDLLMEYKEEVGVEDEDHNVSDHDDHRAKTLMEIMLERGVNLKDNPTGGECFKAREVRHLKNQSFSDLAGYILKGHPLKIKMPITKKFFKLKGSGEMYIGIAGTPDMYTKDSVQVWHSVVLVGFGRKEGVEYFRYMNSHGTEFDDGGFGDLQAAEIKDPFLIVI
ncbi:hypothetical protein CFC21_057939 [Triticum aestivum]|uniref:Peptidase C1A papain C-terminal domain-containing protein n=2 Tax=Triticum aestivum TaxID=4565 RepID=A0A3B6IRX7_WHEAT|nr:cysteine protease-like [Triticum aestivum]KAF7049394.1 hypothetical protein CFC21_057939 [Triticum aestivum]